jgi:hypothetical protein
MGERHFSFLFGVEINCFDILYKKHHFRILRTAERGGSGYARLLFLKEGKNETKISTYSMDSCAGKGNDEKTHLCTHACAHTTHTHTHARTRLHVDAQEREETCVEFVCHTTARPSHCNTALEST